MRRDPAFLADIVEAAESIRRICQAKPIEEVQDDPDKVAAILHYLTVIGEAARRLSAELRESNPELPWPQIIAQRNRIVHGYFGLDWEILWVTISDDLPLLHRWAAHTLTNLPGSTPP